MSHFCLHNLTLLDSVSGMPVCVRARVCERVNGERGRKSSQSQKERETETPGEWGFCRGSGCSCIITPTADKACLCLSFPSPSILSLTHPHPQIHAHTYSVQYVSTEAEGVLHRGEKRKYERGGEGGDAEKGEWRIDL